MGLNQMGMGINQMGMGIYSTGFLSRKGCALDFHTGVWKLFHRVFKPKGVWKLFHRVLAGNGS